MIYRLDLKDKGLISPKLQGVDLGKPYELRFSLNTNSHLWGKIDNQSVIRLKTRYTDLLYVFADRKKKLKGVTDYTFYSASYGLKFEPPLLNNLNLNESAGGILNKLSSNFIFRLVSSDRENILLETGVKNNLELLAEICQRAGGWTYRDAGFEIVNGEYKPIIEVGNFTEYLNNSPLIVRARAGKDLDNLYDDTEVLVEYINENDSGEAITHMLAFADTGAGTNTNTYITFDSGDQGAAWINQKYPIIPVFNEIKGVDEYYIQDTQTPTKPRYKTQVFNLSSSLEEQDLQSIRNLSDLKRQLYRLTVNELQANAAKRKITAGFTYKTVFLPGTLVHLKYVEKVKNYNGEMIEIYNIDQKMIIRDTSFDLEKIKY